MKHRKKRFISYYEKLKDRRWQKVRLDILNRDNFCCQFPDCNSTNSMLDVHHKCYLSNTDPWDYPEYTMITLCQDHHKYEQRRIEQAHLAIARNPTLVTYCIDNGAEIESRTIRKVVKHEIKTFSFEKGKSLFQQMRDAIDAV